MKRITITLCSLFMGFLFVFGRSVSCVSSLSVQEITLKNLVLTDYSFRSFLSSTFCITNYLGILV
ncbi:MAG: hypothetical protein ACI82Q_001868 [Nonlabens sp.]|jgi:hypothetical protein